MYHYLVVTIRTPQFQPGVVERHNAFLEQLRQLGKLVLAGPFTDQSGGAYVLKAESLEDAQSIAFGDPVHITKSSNVSIHEWRAT